MRSVYKIASCYQWVVLELAKHSVKCVGIRLIQGCLLRPMSILQPPDTRNL